VTIPDVSGAKTASVRDFGDDESLLTDVLDEVVLASDGQQALELHRQVVALSRVVHGGDDEAADRLTALVADLDLDRSEILVRSRAGSS